MATENVFRYRRLDRWSAGVASGLIAGTVMGLILHFVLDAMPIIGALVGQPTVLVGWVVHLFNSVVFSLLFVAVVSRPIVSDYTGSAGEIVALGLADGAVLGLVTGGVLLPVSINFLSERSLPVPLLPVPGIDYFTFSVVLAFAHLVFGLFLGASYAVLSEDVPRRIDPTPEG